MAARPPLSPHNMSLLLSNMLCSSLFYRCGRVLPALLVISFSLCPLHSYSSLSCTPSFFPPLSPALLSSPFIPFFLSSSLFSSLPLSPSLFPLSSLLSLYPLLSSSLLSSLCPTATTTDRRTSLDSPAVSRNPAAAAQPTSAPHPHSEACHSEPPPSPAARPRRDCNNPHTPLTRQRWHRCRDAPSTFQFVSTPSSATAVLNDSAGGERGRNSKG